MTALSKERSDLCLLSGDIGNRMFDRYKEVAPSFVRRFLIAASQDSAELEHE